MKAKPISIRLSKEPREALKKLSEEWHLPQSTIIDLILKAGCELIESAKGGVTLPLHFEFSKKQAFEVKNDNLPKIASLLEMHEKHSNYTNKNADRREFLNLSVVVRTTRNKKAQLLEPQCFEMAERTGFEPVEDRLDLHRFSKPAHSTTLPSLLK